MSIKTYNGHMFVAIDSGGTNTRIGLTKDLNTIQDIIKYPTPKKYSDYVGKLNSELKKIEDIKGIVFGVAGLVDRKAKLIVKSPHIPYLDNKSVNDIFQMDTSLISVENDATLAGFAESILGEGKSYSRVAYITISTGVGGTIIINKSMPITRYNFEPGHHIINFHGRELAMRNVKGSWESFSSGTGFKQRYGIEPAEHNDSAIWNEYGEMLGIGLHNLSLLWQPDVIVLGGSMSKKASLFLTALNKSLDRTLPFSKPDIKISTLGDENGLMGGFEYLRRN